jgi:hypothetical protein
MNDAFVVHLWKRASPVPLIWQALVIDHQWDTSRDARYLENKESNMQSHVSSLSEPLSRRLELVPAVG